MDEVINEVMDEVKVSVPSLSAVKRPKTTFAKHLVSVAVRPHFAQVNLLGTLISRASTTSPRPPNMLTRS